MSLEKGIRGAASSGAGRPEAKMQNIRIQLLQEEHKLLHNLGGNAWIHRKLAQRLKRA